MKKRDLINEILRYTVNKMYTIDFLKCFTKEELWFIYTEVYLLDR